MRDRGDGGQVRGDDSAPGGRWNDALARYRSAEAALAAGQGACDSRFDRLLGRHNRALSRLLRSPAPDVPALAVKPVLSEVEGLDALVANQAWELSFAPACLAALRRDARRLAAAAAG